MLDYLNQVGGESDNLLFGANGFSLSAAAEADFIESVNRSPCSALFLGWAQGELVSVGGVMTGERERIRHHAEVSISVKRAHWRQGIGTRMMRRMIDFARANGQTEILHLGVRADNFSAIRLYQSLGFQEIGVFPRFFKIDGVYGDELLMNLSLRPADRGADWQAAPLETDRLLLCPPGGTDAGIVAAYLARNRRFLAAYEPARSDAYYEEAAQRELLRRQARDFRDGTSRRFYLAARERPQEVIGFVALNGIVMDAFCGCYLSYQLDCGHLNRGYMTEAVSKTVAYAFEALGLHRLEANIMPRNAASIRVAEKCGFENEGVSKRYLNINGVWEDHFHYVRRNAALEPRRSD